MRQVYVSIYDPKLKITEHFIAELHDVQMLTLSFAAPELYTVCMLIVKRHNTSLLT